MIVMSILLGIIFSIGGLFISYKYNIPSGATIILLSVLGYFIGYGLNKIVLKR